MDRLSQNAKLALEVRSLGGFYSSLALETHDTDHEGQFCLNVASCVWNHLMVFSYKQNATISMWDV